LISQSRGLGDVYKRQTKLRCEVSTRSAFKRRGMISDSMMDKMEDWHSAGLPLYVLEKSSLDAEEFLENMDIAIHVILAMGFSLLSFCKTATGFMRGCSVDLVVARWPIHPQFIPGWVNKQASRCLKREYPRQISAYLVFKDPLVDPVDRPPHQQDHKRQTNG
jgi:hypothetical protein